MSRRSLCLLIVMAAVIGPSHAMAPEKADLSPEMLLKTATHVVVGKVEQIWTRAESRGVWDWTHYVAEIRVQRVEKGEGLAADGLVYARYWTKKWNGFFGQQPPDTNGHRGLPAVGEQIRVYLARNAYDGFGTTSDGGFNVIGANGFVRP